MTGLGGRRQRRVWLLVGVVCGVVAVVSAVYVVRQLTRGGLEAGETAGLLAVPLAVAAVAAGVAALRKPVQGDDAALARGRAATLADQVEAGEGAVRRQLLGDDTKRIGLVYRLYPGGVRPAAAPGAGRLFTAGAGGPALPDIVAFYREVRPERLVITGAGGAGKTVCALELLLGLIEGRGEGDPVPVRVPLSRWDTERQTLPQLLETRLVEAYDWPPKAAAGLVRHGLVLPVLDGLDEMDPPGPGGVPDPGAPRAVAVVEALNRYQRGLEAGPLILTCRTAHYDALHPQTAVVDAARIGIEPVDAAHAGEYLKGRALDEARWRTLTDHLANEPQGMLAGVLSTPWRLGLVATVYHRDGNPGELLALQDADAVDEYLLARYIPAAIRLAPTPDRYTADQVHRWLHRLTTHLDPAGTAGGTGTAAGTGGQGPEGTDLLLHELWPLAGRARVKAADALLSVLAVLTALVLAPTESAWLFAPVFAVMAGVYGFMEVGAPGRWTNPLRRARARRGITAGIVFTIAGVIVFGITAGATAGIVFGIAGVITAVVAPALVNEPGANRGARAAMRNDALLGLPAGAAVGTTVGITVGIISGTTVGIAFGIMAMLTFGAASRRYLVFLVCSLGRLPFRLGRFLDWAVGAGLLRCSGAGFQYRHREFQHWLRHHPHPPHVP
ncbi:hypothetical protein ACWEFL_35785 [Streptomyces sp. NPDC004838]